MIAQLSRRFKRQSSGLLASRLYNERTFYRVFARDLAHCRNEALVESPFLTTRRVEALLPTIRKLIGRGVRVVVNTRHPEEHEGYLREEAESCIALLLSCGVEILFTGGHHRKLAIFDRKILYEGSLNILSQNDSAEIMRRVESEEWAVQTISFIGVTSLLQNESKIKLT